jgi:hypothetical protein
MEFVTRLESRSKCSANLRGALRKEGIMTAVDGSEDAEKNKSPKPSPARDTKMR